MRFLNAASNSESFWKKEPRNPAPDDVPPDLNALWLNTATGEIFVHVRNCSDGAAIWKGQLGTLVAPSTVTKFDIFEDSSAIALYRLDGSPFDDGGLYHGKWNGNEQYDVGVFGQAAKFDGRSNIVVSSLPCSQISCISLWAKTSRGDILQNFIGIENNSYRDIFILGYNRGGLYCQINNNNDTSPKVELELDKWYHIVANFDVKNNRTIFFINGEAKVFLNIAPKLIDGLIFYIGSENAGGNLYGFVDQIRIFNRTLTDEEVQLLYTEGGIC